MSTTLQVASTTLQSDINTEKALIFFNWVQEEEMLFYHLQYKIILFLLKYIYFWTMCHPENSIPSSLTHKFKNLKFTY